MRSASSALRSASSSFLARSLPWTIEELASSSAELADEVRVLRLDDRRSGRPFGDLALDRGRSALMPASSPVDCDSSDTTGWSASSSSTCSFCSAISFFCCAWRAGRPPARRPGPGRCRGRADAAEDEREEQENGRESATGPSSRGCRPRAELQPCPGGTDRGSDWRLLHLGDVIVTRFSVACQRADRTPVGSAAGPWRQPSG